MLVHKENCRRRFNWYTWGVHKNCMKNTSTLRVVSQMLDAWKGPQILPLALCLLFRRSHDSTPTQEIHSTTNLALLGNLQICLICIGTSSFWVWAKYCLFRISHDTLPALFWYRNSLNACANLAPLHMVHARTHVVCGLALTQVMLFCRYIKYVATHMMHLWHGKPRSR